MDSLDYWRFCDELTIVQAALLIVGCDPTGVDWSVDSKVPSAQPQGYNAVSTALRHSILAETLKATIVMHQPDYNSSEEGILWKETRVSVVDLREWLSKRGVKDGFFFPDEPVTVDYLDSDNDSFAPKLAAAVTAWKAVRAERAAKPPGRSVKSDLVKWLNLHAADYGLTNDEGEPNKLAIEEVAKVANWDAKGGAPKTPGN